MRDFLERFLLSALALVPIEHVVLDLREADDQDFRDGCRFCGFGGIRGTLLRQASPCANEYRKPPFCAQSGGTGPLIARK